MSGDEYDTQLADLHEALAEHEQAPPGSREALVAIDRAVTLAQACLRAEVGEARRGGMAWSGVGSALGVSRQAAEMRFGAGQRG